MEAGLSVAVIGMGTPEQSRAFRARLNLPFPVLSDSEKQAYAAYGLGRVDWRNEVTPDNLASLARYAVRHGGALTPDQDMRQLGGYFVVDREGTVRGAYPSEQIADLADLDVLTQPLL